MSYPVKNSPCFKRKFTTELIPEPTEDETETGREKPAGMSCSDVDLLPARSKSALTGIFRPGGETDRDLSIPDQLLKVRLFPSTFLLRYMALSAAAYSLSNVTSFSPL